MVLYDNVSVLKQLTPLSVFSIATVYLLAVPNILPTDCKRLRMQLHDLSIKPIPHPPTKPILQSLHWLPIKCKHTIKVKVSRICFNEITGTGPQYLDKLPGLYASSRDLCSSVDTCIPKIPHSIPKHLVKDQFHITVPLCGMIFLTICTILILVQTLK